MTYKTLLVHLDLYTDNKGVLGVAAQLAEKFGARVVGIASAQPTLLMFEEGGAMAQVVSEEHAELEKELENCGDQFRAVFKHRLPHAEWRSAVTYGPLADYVADQARCADLIITGQGMGISLIDNSRRMSAGNLALRAGRPVLIVPPGVSNLSLRHVFLAWKDSREARRAAADGLPLLQQAGLATVVEVTSDTGAEVAGARVKDVALWLESHGVTAKSQAIETSSNHAAYLHAHLLDRKCDLLVAGAYGHSRLGEWVFGGVTLDVLLEPDFCVLVSH